jgi:spore coat protein U-like protein
MRFSSTVRSAALAVAAVFVLATAAYASTATTTMTVASAVASNCSIAAAPLSFGTYNGTADVHASAAVTANCTSTTQYGITLSSANSYKLNGTGSNTTYLNYVLTQSDYSTSLAGVLVAALAATGTGANQSYTVYGKIASGQTTAQPDTYSDTVTLTVTY